MKQNNIKRMVAVLLCLVMVVSMVEINAPAKAAEAPKTTGSLQAIRSGVGAVLANSISLSQTSTWSVGASGGSKTVTVTSTIAIQSVSKPSWISYTYSKSGTKYTYTFTASANTGGARSGSISFFDGGSGASFSVSQAGKPPTNTPKPPTNTPKPPTNTPKPPTNTPKPPTNTPVPIRISLNSSSVDFACGSGRKSVGISTNGTISGANKSQSWIRPSISGNSVVIDVDANYYSSKRSGTVTVYTTSGASASLTVTQNGNSLGVSKPANTTLSCSGGTMYVNAWTGIGSASASSSASWASAYYDSTNKRAVISYGENNTGANRATTITISAYDMSQQFTLVQLSHSLSVSTNSISLGAGGGAKNLAVTADCSYSYGKDATWITVSSISGGYAISAQANTGSGSRTGHVTVSGGGIQRTVTVTQSGNSLSVTGPSGTLGYAAGKATATVSLTTGNAATVSSNASWATPSYSSSDKKITISYTENNSGASRSATITVTAYGMSKTFTITQAAHSLSVASTSISLDATGSAKNLAVTADCSYSYGKDATWITVSTISGGYAISAQANTGSGSRTGHVTVSGGGIQRTVTVTQKGNVLSVTGPSGTLGYAAGKATATVSLTTGNAATVSSNASWATPTYDKSTKKITIAYTENNSGASRSATITVTAYGMSKTFTITQAAHSLSVASTSISLDATGSAKNLSVTADCSYSYGKDATWITVSTISGGYAISAQANTGSSARTGHVTVSGGGIQRTVTVTQKGNVLSVTGPSGTLGYAAGKATATVSLTTGNAATVSSNASWATPTYDKSTKKITIAYTENNSGASRSATITVTAYGMSKTFKITQKAHSLTVAVTELTLDAKGSASNVGVTADCTYTYGKDATWVTVSAISGGYAISAQANTNSSKRTAHVTVSGAGISRVITVTQSGNTMSLDATSRTFYPEGGSLSTTVTVAAGTPKATVDSNGTGWLTASVSGTKVTFKATENRTGAERSSVVTVKVGNISKTVTVKQKRYTLTIPQDYWNPGAAKSTLTLPCTASAKNGFTVSSNQTWLTATVDAEGMIQLAVTNNVNNTDRKGNVTVTSGDRTEQIAVVQKANTLTVSKTSETISAKEQAVTLTFKKGAGTVTVTSSATWATVSVSGSTVTVTATSNRSGTVRNATIAFKVGNITRNFKLTQNPYALTSSVSNTDLDARGGRVQVYLTLSDVGEVTTNTPNDWITVKKNSDSSFTLTVAPNPNNTVRAGYVKFEQKSLGSSFVYTVTEKYNEIKCESITTLAAYGETQKINVSALAGTLSVSTTSTWLTATLKNGVLTLTAPANKGTSTRSSKVILKAGNAEKVLVIHQYVSIAAIANGEYLDENNESRVGGAKYKKWYGLGENDAWCAAFVAWCADQCGYIDAGLMPRSAYCPYCVNWYKERNEWLPGTATPSVGMIIFYDWGTDEVSDHTGVVVAVSGSTITVVEGNKSNEVGKRTIKVGDSSILGYGAPKGTIAKVTVSFDANRGYGSQLIQNQTYNVGCEYGYLPAQPAAPSSDVYFEGWYTDRYKGTLVTVGTIAEANVTTLYARWVGTKPVKVTFDLNGGNKGQEQSLQAISVVYGKQYGDGIRDGWIRTGYTFDGWYTEKANGKGNKVTKISTVTKNTDHTLYAHWTPITYKVAFNANGGTGTMTTQTYTYNQSYTLPANTFTKKGYVLGSWNTKKDGTGKKYKDLDSVKNLTTVKNGTVTLYAQWSDNAYSTTFYYTGEDTNPDSYEGLKERESYDYNINFDWFFNSSYTYNHNLVRASLKTAMAAFDAYPSGLNPTANIEDLMTKLEFTDIQALYPELTSSNTIGYAIARKNIVDSATGEQSTLILVTVRGAGYGNEWGGNFNVGGSSNLNHVGFNNAASMVINGEKWDGVLQDGLKQYVEKHKSTFTGKLKVWVVGYSRAAATSNLICASLINNGQVGGVSLASTDVFGYCFECPRCTTSTAVGNTKYKGIKNIVNSADFVPMVAMNNGKQWTFTRYGETYLADGGSWDNMKSSYRDIVKRMKNHGSDYYSVVNELTVQESAQYASQGELLQAIIGTLTDLIPNRDVYISCGLQEALMDFMGNYHIFGLLSKLKLIHDIVDVLVELDDNCKGSVAMALAEIITEMLSEDTEMKTEQDARNCIVSMAAAGVSLSGKAPTSVKLTESNILTGISIYYAMKTLIDLVSGVADTGIAAGSCIAHAHYPELCLAWMESSTSLKRY